MKKISEYEPPKRMMIDVESLFDCDTCYHNQNGQCNTSCDAGESYRPAMSKLEIIEAEPVRHGRWEESGGQLTPMHRHDEFTNPDQIFYGKCSVCGITVYQNGVLNGFNYCPHCGAKMDKNVSEHDGDVLRLNEDGTTEWRKEIEHE